MSRWGCTDANDMPSPSSNGHLQRVLQSHLTRPFALPLLCFFASLKLGRLNDVFALPSALRICPSAHPPISYLQFQHFPPTPHPQADTSGYYSALSGSQSGLTSKSYRSCGGAGQLVLEDRWRWRRRRRCIAIGLRNAIETPLGLPRGMLNRTHEQTPTKRDFGLLAFDF